MADFANSRFWRFIAVALVVLLALDVGHRLLSSSALPDLMPAALAAGGIVNTVDDGIVTTNQDGTIVYRWGKVQGTPGGLTVQRFDASKLTIDRLDLK